jgi:hypothetical protein
MRTNTPPPLCGLGLAASTALQSYKQIKQAMTNINVRASRSHCLYRRVPKFFTPVVSLQFSCCDLSVREKAWLAACVSLRLPRLPRTASSAQRSRRLRSTRAAAPVLLAQAEVTKKHHIYFQWVQNLGTPRHFFECMTSAPHNTNAPSSASPLML